MPDYHAVVTLDIAAPAKAVWDGITNPNIVKQYMHGATVHSDWRTGSKIIWEGVWNDTPYEDKGEVLQSEPYSLLKMTHWSPMGGAEDKPENYHVITFSLAEVDGVTHLELTQSNNPSQEAADAMAKNGWQPMMETMKRIVETSARA